MKASEARCPVGQCERIEGAKENFSERFQEVSKRLDAAVERIEKCASDMHNATLEAGITFAKLTERLEAGNKKFQRVDEKLKEIPPLRTDLEVLKDREVRHGLYGAGGGGLIIGLFELTKYLMGK